MLIPFTRRVNLTLAIVVSESSDGIISILMFEFAADLWFQFSRNRTGIFITSTAAAVGS